MDVRAAIAFEADKPLEVVEAQLSGPGPGEVLIQIKATGLCHSDLSVMEGKVPQYAFPIVLGHEGAGIVVECGEGVTSVKPGDHVVPAAVPECRQCRLCTSGRTNMCEQMFVRAPSHISYKGESITSFCGTATFAEYAVIREIQLAKIRQDAPFDASCYVGCGVITGVGAALSTGKVFPGASVAVFGLGGIGLNVLQGAKIGGATRIIGVDLNPDREAVARKFGATDFINPKNVDDVVEHIQKLTGGGVDIAFECVGSEKLAQQAVMCTNVAWGKGVGVGIGGPETRLDFDPRAFLSGRSWTGSYLGGEKPRTAMPRLVDWYMDGFLNIDDLITHHISLDEINHGFDMMRSGEAIRTVITFD